MKSWPKDSTGVCLFERRGWSVVAVAKAELLAAPARARLVGTAPIVLGVDQGHHVGRWAPPPQQVGHGPHRLSPVGEDKPQALTQVDFGKIGIPPEGES